jgi:hypothetical protein
MQAAARTRSPFPGTVPLVGLNQVSRLFKAQGKQDTDLELASMPAATAGGRLERLKD